MTVDESLAWGLYCEETAGDMDVRDSWEQLPAHVQQLYLRKSFGQVLDVGQKADNK
jgi:hypothetical protein